MKNGILIGIFVGLMALSLVGTGAGKIKSCWRKKIGLVCVFPISSLSITKLYVYLLRRKVRR